MTSDRLMHARWLDHMRNSEAVFVKDTAAATMLPRVVVGLPKVTHAPIGLLQHTR